MFAFYRGPPIARPRSRLRTAQRGSEPPGRCRDGLFALSTFCSSVGLPQIAELSPPLHPQMERGQGVRTRAPLSPEFSVRPIEVHHVALRLQPLHQDDPPRLNPIHLPRLTHDPRVLVLAFELAQVV